MAVAITDRVSRYTKKINANQMVMWVMVEPSELINKWINVFLGDAAVKSHLGGPISSPVS